MKKYCFLFLFILSCIHTYTNSQSNTKSISYLSPAPNSQYVKRQTNIIIKTGDYYDINSVKIPSVINVRGTKSGLHEGKLILAEANKTLIFKPKNIFDYAETVYVNISNGLETNSGKSVQSLSYHFMTCKSDIEVDPVEILKNEKSQM